MKRTHWILLAVLLATVAVAWFLTHDAEDGGILVVIDTLPTDGPLPQPLFAQSLDEEGEGERFELVPVPGVPHTYRAPGTVAGYFDFFNAEGWRFINTGPRLPYFDPSKPPPRIPMGRPYCAYVRAHSTGGFVLESVVAVERIGGSRKDGFTYTLIDAEIVKHAQGWISARLPPAECQPGTEFRLSGWMSGQHPFDPIKLNVGPQPRRPYVCIARPASVGRLQVVLVGGPDAALDQVEITAKLRGLPLQLTDRIKTANGVATFPALGAFADGLLLEVPAWGPGAAYTLSVDRWRREGTVFLRALDPAQATWVDVQVPEGVTVENIGVLDAATDRFALAQIDRTATGLRVRTPSGPQTWIVHAGSKAHAFEVDVDGTPVTLPVLSEQVRVRGKLAVARGGYRVRFLRSVGDRWVGGNGMEVDARIGSRYEAHIAPGRYRIQVLQPGGRASKPLTLTWDAGANVELPLDVK